MDQIIYSCIGMACASVVLIWVWSVLNWVWLRPKKLERCLRSQGLSGNSYKLLFGDQKESSAMLKETKSRPINLSDDIVPRVLPHVHKSVLNYGKNSFSWLGPKPRVYIMDPELIKEILANNFTFKRPKTNPLTKLLADGLSGQEGEKWAKHRKIINPAFHMEKLKHMLPAIDMSCSEIISKWEKMVNTREGSSCEVDVYPYLETLSSDVISRTAFGSNYEEGRKIFQLQKQQGDLAIQALNSVYIPGYRFLPTKGNKRMKEIDKETRASLMDIINKRMKALNAGETTNSDLLGLLLESNLRESSQQQVEKGDKRKKGSGMSINQVIEECKLFYLAGQETTSSLLVWTLVLLSQHQDWQQLAREEVLQVFGNDKPNFDGLNHLKIVTMILYEVLRLYPPIVMLSRTVYEETKVGKMSIPAGVLLTLPIILVHHDKEIWGDDVGKFKPDRFSEGVSKATKNQVSFFPFSWGPRVCIGQNFAMLEAKMALAMILQNFSFELSPFYSHAPYTIVTLQPQYGAHLILHKL